MISYTFIFLFAQTMIQGIASVLKQSINLSYLEKESSLVIEKAIYPNYRVWNELKLKVSMRGKGDRRYQRTDTTMTNWRNVNEK